LIPKAEDPDFRTQWGAVKAACKHRLADWISDHMKVTIDPDRTMFDVQVKRIHEYKRQALNVFSIIDRYLRILDGDTEGMVPRASLIGGKAAPGYYFAKKLIKLVNNVSRVVNNDPKADGLLQVLYLPNYNVSLAEIIIPGADINQQISTAGTEASGTSNMKFAFNSSLIVGTWDGANIEIGEAAGEENVFFFGAKADEVDAIRAGAATRPINPRLKRVFDAIKGGMFGDPNEYGCIWSSVEGKDQYLVNGDFQAYLDIQAAVDLAYTDKDAWIRKCIIQTANMGRFSSDRTINEYAEQIWGIVPHPLPEPQISGPDGEEFSPPPVIMPKVGSADRIGSASRRHQMAAAAVLPPQSSRNQGTTKPKEPSDEDEVPIDDP
jgi:starch phosphorylase